MPKTAPPNTHANTTKLDVMGLTVGLSSRLVGDDAPLLCTVS
ncbi:MAG TPA: hypothetical protein VNI81_04520 [Candidatus Limnocylindrales bacterium]|nr:hypothetical protein [Candidatus Limnocylindrales bacterium]